MWGVLTERLESEVAWTELGECIKLDRNRPGKSKSREVIAEFGILVDSCG